MHSSAMTKNIFHAQRFTFCSFVHPFIWATTLNILHALRLTLSRCTQLFSSRRMLNILHLQGTRHLIPGNLHLPPFKTKIYSKIIVCNSQFFEGFLVDDSKISGALQLTVFCPPFPPAPEMTLNISLDSGWNHLRHRCLWNRWYHICIEASQPKRSSSTTPKYLK